MLSAAMKVRTTKTEIAAIQTLLPATPNRESQKGALESQPQAPETRLSKHCSPDGSWRLSVTTKTPRIVSTCRLCIHETENHPYPYSPGAMLVMTYGQKHGI